MKIDNVFITRIEVDSKWNDNSDTWEGWDSVKFSAYGKSKHDTSVHLTIEATPEERELVFKLMERVTKRVRDEGE